MPVPTKGVGVVRVRRGEARGRADFGWLDSRHTFSFGEYHDPRHMGFRALRVINEDRVLGGGGFPTHPHRDMEIISYVLEGAMQHKDSLGTGSIIRPGDVQRMSAAAGVSHSEFNHSQAEPVHFFQIWIVPEVSGLQPGYEQKTFADAQKRGVLRLVGSRAGRDESITIHQDVDLYATLLDAEQRVRHSVGRGRGVWVQVARGRLAVNGTTLAAGDGASLEDVDDVDLHALESSEFLLFDLK